MIVEYRPQISILAHVASNVAQVSTILSGYYTLFHGLAGTTCAACSFTAYLLLRDLTNRFELERPSERKLVRFSVNAIFLVSAIYLIAKNIFGTDSIALSLTMTALGYMGFKLVKAGACPPQLDHLEVKWAAERQ